MGFRQQRGVHEGSPVTCGRCCSRRCHESGVVNGTRSRGDLVCFGVGSGGAEAYDVVSLCQRLAPLFRAGGGRRFTKEAEATLEDLMMMTMLFYLFLGGYLSSISVLNEQWLACAKMSLIQSQIRLECLFSDSRVYFNKQLMKSESGNKRGLKTGFTGIYIYILFLLLIYRI